MAFAQFNARKTYFDGIGTKLNGIQKTEQAIQLSGLDYTVEKQPIYLANGNEIPNKFATVRTDTNEALGIVGKNYQVVQNIEGFSFLDELTGNGGADFECAGSIGNGKGAYMLARTDKLKILDDDFDPYMLFINSHDGSSPVKCMFTPIRTFCSNCLALATKQASVNLTVRHNSTVKDKLQIAQGVMKQHTAYISDIRKDAEILATTQFTKEQFENALYTLIKVKEGASETLQERAETARLGLMSAYNQHELQNFNNTGWKALQAVADYASHYLPNRKTDNDLIYLQRVQNGEIAAMLGVMVGLILKQNPATKLVLNY